MFQILVLSFISLFAAEASKSECSVITAKHYKSKLAPIELERCAIGVGGATYDLEAAPIQHYYLSGKLFSGAVLESPEGYVYKTEKDLRKTSTKSEVDLAEKFNCSKRQTNDFQCMVCNCFFEARGQNFDEQVMVNRTVLSRVLSPSHPNSVCGVVHEKSQFSWTLDFKKYRYKPYKKNQSLILGENSRDLKPHDKEAFRKCVASSKEAMKYDNEFFASYYVSKKIRKPAWLQTCEYRSKRKRIKITNKDNRIGKKDLAHNFYRVCETKENVCLKSPDCKGGV
jgi:spore germination cell wall hydrolase CwlJ-like protein